MVDINNDFKIDHKDITLLLKGWNTSYTNDTLNEVINNWDEDLKTEFNSKVVKANYLEGINTTIFDNAELDIKTNLAQYFNYVDVVANDSSNNIDVTIGYPVNGDLTDIAHVITELDKYNKPQPGDNTSQKHARCEIVMDGYVKRKDFYVIPSSTNECFKFYNTKNDAEEETNNIGYLDLNYESEYGFIGIDGTQNTWNQVNDKFRIGVYPYEGVGDATIIKVTILDLINNAPAKPQDYGGDNPQWNRYCLRHKALNRKLQYERADNLTCETGTSIDTLQWLDESGALLENQTGNDVNITGPYTGNEHGNKLYIKLKYEPVNYLGFKSTSRLFCRNEEATDNMQISINTPHNIVKIFDYSLLDHEYDLYGPGGSVSTESYNSPYDSNGITLSSIDHFQYQHSFGDGNVIYGSNKIREALALTIKRIEKQIRFTDEVLAKRKKELDSGTIYNGHNTRGIGTFNDELYWKGVWLNQLSIRSSTSTTPLASASVVFNNSEGRVLASFLNIYYGEDGYSDYVTHPIGTVDLLTHELIHGLGIVPSRTAFTENSVPLPQVTTETYTNTNGGRIYLRQHPLNNNYQYDEGGTMPFYTKDYYPDTCRKYQEYISSINDWNEPVTKAPIGSNIVMKIINDVDEKTPLENGGSAGTYSAHFEKFGFLTGPEVNDNFYAGLGNELMTGYFPKQPPYGIITGVTLNAAEPIYEIDSNGTLTKVFKILREDGELVPVNPTNDDLKNIPWHTYNDDYTIVPFTKEVAVLPNNNQDANIWQNNANPTIPAQYLIFNRKVLKNGSQQNRGFSFVKDMSRKYNCDCAGGHP